MIRTTLISTDEIKLETRDGGFLFLHWSDIMAVSSVALTDDYQKFVVKVHLANGNIETLKGFYDKIGRKPTTSVVGMNAFLKE